MARIVGICDAFDAMTSHRPYRHGMARDRALAIIRDQRGSQFDSRLADVFIALGTDGAAHWAHAGDVKRRASQ